MSDYATNPAEEEQSDQQKALARKWSKRIESALKAQTESKQEERYKKNRQYVRGDAGSDGKGGLVRTNIIHSNFAAILPQIYAKNPEISVIPTEAAGGNAYGWVGPFCKTMQAVLNRSFVTDGKLKKRAKSAIRAAMTTSMGWTKVSWQKDIRKDPIIENRIADTQDNIQKIRQLISDIEDGDDSRGELEAKQAELDQQMAALQAQAEVVAASGIVIDRVLTEDIFILDDAINDFDAYEQAEAIAHRVWMTVDKYKEMFGKEPPKKASRYGSDKKDRSSNTSDNKAELVAVFEIWNRIDNTVYTLCNGCDEWARDPYTPQTLGRRFYSFFALAFNPVDGRMEPLSDAELLIELQDEYSTTRTNFSEHRKENLPVRLARKGGSLTDKDILSITNRRSNDIILVEGDPNTPLQNDLAVMQNPPIDPATYDVQPILRDAEMVLGAGDAAKGVVNKAKTATEAEIMAQGLQSRVAERQDVVEDWIADMANYAAELCLQEMGLEEVKRIAGPEAVWPQMNREQVFGLVSIEIRAGSTGRPNQAKEREQWGALLPQIQQAITQIGQMRETGQQDMAETAMKLLEETLRRFDERIDIESFLPKKQEGEQPPAIPPEVQQQIEQGKAMFEQLQAENAQLKQIAEGSAAKMDLERERFDWEKRKAVDEFNARQSSDQEAIAARLEEVRIKAEADAAAKIEIERIRSADKQAELASQERIALAREMFGIAQTGQAVQDQQATAQQAGQQAENLTAMMQQMQQAMADMGGQFAQALTGMQAQMTAPRRVIRDPDTGDMIGVEVVQ
jgi:hypothetical protein